MLSQSIIVLYVLFSDLIISMSLACRKHIFLKYKITNCLQALFVIFVSLLTNQLCIIMKFTNNEQNETSTIKIETHNWIRDKKHKLLIYTMACLPWASIQMFINRLRLQFREKLISICIQDAQSRSKCEDESVFIIRFE